MFQAAGVALRRQCPEAPIRVFADAGRLSQVLDNVLDDALKFTPAGEHVDGSLEFDNAAQNTNVRVRDPGIGIDAETLDGLFEASAQGDPVA